MQSTTAIFVRIAFGKKAAFFNLKNVGDTRAEYLPAPGDAKAAAWSRFVALELALNDVLAKSELKEQKEKQDPADLEDAVRTLLRRKKAQIDGTAPPASWPEKIRREKNTWIADIDTAALPGGYSERIVVEVKEAGGHFGDPDLKAGSSAEKPLSVSIRLRPVTREDIRSIQALRRDRGRHTGFARVVVCCSGPGK